MQLMMVGRILPERQELKVGLLTKKAQNKSYFFTSDNYSKRVFVLDTQCLTYFTGTVEVWIGMCEASLCLNSLHPTFKKSKHCVAQGFFPSIFLTTDSKLKLK